MVNTILEDLYDLKESLDTQVSAVVTRYYAEGGPTTPIEAKSIYYALTDDNKPLLGELMAAQANVLLAIATLQRDPDAKKAHHRPNDETLRNSISSRYMYCEYHEGRQATFEVLDRSKNVAFGLCPECFHISLSKVLENDSKETDGE